MPGGCYPRTGRSARHTLSLTDCLGDGIATVNGQHKQTPCCDPGWQAVTAIGYGNRSSDARGRPYYGSTRPISRRVTLNVGFCVLHLCVIRTVLNPRTEGVWLGGVGMWGSASYECLSTRILASRSIDSTKYPQPLRPSLKSIRLSLEASSLGRSLVGEFIVLAG